MQLHATLQCGERHRLQVSQTSAQPEYLKSSIYCGAYWGDLSLKRRENLLIAWPVNVLAISFFLKQKVTGWTRDVTPKSVSL